MDQRCSILRIDTVVTYRVGSPEMKLWVAFPNARRFQMPARKYPDRSIAHSQNVVDYGSFLFDGYWASLRSLMMTSLKSLVDKSAAGVEQPECCG